MKLLTGPYDWCWNSALQGASYYIKGVDTGSFISGELIYGRNICPPYLESICRWVRAKRRTPNMLEIKGVRQ